LHEVFVIRLDLLRICELFGFEVNEEEQLFVQNVHFEADKAEDEAQEYADNYEKEFLANREEQAKKDAEAADEETTE